MGCLDCVKFFSGLVPSYSNVNRAEVWYAAIQRGVAQRSPHQPSLVVVGVADGDIITDTLSISIDASDDDGDDLYWQVEYSHDQGLSWAPLSFVSNINDSDGVSIDVRHIPHSQLGRIRVFVSDGFNMTSSIINNLSIGENHEPSINIISPDDGDVFEVGMNIVFSAQVRDLEDGALPALSITWSVTGVGVLGHGETLNYSALPIGIHEINVTAIDGDGLSDTSSIMIEVTE